jgi:hypothetical protein
MSGAVASGARTELARRAYASTQELRRPHVPQVSMRVNSKSYRNCATEEEPPCH